MPPLELKVDAIQLDTSVAVSCSTTALTTARYLATVSVALIKRYHLKVERNSYTLPRTALGRPAQNGILIMLVVDSSER